MAVFCLGVCACASPAPATKQTRALVVGTSGDYAPFSVAAGDGALSGFDLALARAFARHEGDALSLVRFAWPSLSRAVRERRFDVAMSGVTVRPERSVVGRFSLPVAESGAVVLIARELAAGGIEGLDRAGVRIAVNAGGHLERVARRTFPRAVLTPMPENDAVRRALAAGEVDAAVTDTLEAPHWQGSLPGVARLGPFTQDRKAYLWAVDAAASSAWAVDAAASPAGNAARAERLDAWLLAREADGTLAAWREQYLGAPGPATATPLGALLSGVAERLALMPLVAEAKRDRGRAVRDRAREAHVLEAARSGVARRASEVGRPIPAAARVDAFYRAQIEAAVAIQTETLAAPRTPNIPIFDLSTELRPALLRIGDRIAWALVRLDRAPGPEALSAALRIELAPFGLGAEHVEPLAEAILALTQDLVKARASSPAITGSTSDTP